MHATYQNLNRNINIHKEDEVNCMRLEESVCVMIRYLIKETLQR